jgi:cytochrome c-type biogenesis protein CcmH
MRLPFAAVPALLWLAWASPVQADVTGVVRLAPELKELADPDDTLFVFARAASGPRMPLALERVRVADLPYAFHLDDGSAMMPRMRLSNFDRVAVVARVSKSGNAMPGSGDLEGLGPTVGNDASNLEIVIDRVLP